MGIVYIVLRVAMGIILLTTLALSAIQYTQFGPAYFSPFVIGFWVLIVVLFVNAVLMTKHIMPSNIGPALQASSWYTMGIMLALSSLGLYGFSLLAFSVGYAVMITLAVSLVNAIMFLLKAGR